MSPRSATTKPGEGIGLRLRAAREKRGITQVELARRAGLSQTAVSQIESGERRDPERDTVRKLEAGLGKPRIRLSVPRSTEERIDEALDDFLSAYPDEVLGDTDQSALREAMALVYDLTMSPMAIRLMQLTLKKRRGGASPPTRIASAMLRIVSTNRGNLILAAALQALEDVRALLRSRLEPVMGRAHDLKATEVARVIADVEPLMKQAHSALRLSRAALAVVPALDPDSARSAGQKTLRDDLMREAASLVDLVESFPLKGNTGHEG